MGHAGVDGAALGKAMLTPKAKHTGKSLAVGVKWARRWDAAAPASDTQPIQLKYLDVTQVTWPAWYPEKQRHGATVPRDLRGKKAYVYIYVSIVWFLLLKKVLLNTFAIL